MIKNIRIIGLAIIVFLAMLSSVALTPARHPSQDLTSVATLPAIVDTLVSTHSAPPATATPGKIKPTPTPNITQVGNSDRIVVIGILIVGIIVVPILLRRKEWSGS